MPTMCKNNSREKACLSVFSPHKNCNGLIGFPPAIGYYSYTQRWRQGGTLNGHTETNN
jgi:hypothetical protein